MKTIEKTVYTFEELSEKAKEKATNYFIESWLDTDDYAELDYFNSMLEEKGFMEPKISWSGFWSQGDGASFTCNFVDIDAYIKAYNLTDKNHKMFLAAWKRGWVENIEITKTSSRYSHENTMDISWNCNLQKSSSKWIEDIFDGIVQNILATAKDLAREVYKGLEEQYEYCSSEEYIKEMYNNNDMEFFGDGTIYR